MFKFAGNIARFVRYAVSLRRVASYANNATFLLSDGKTYYVLHVIETLHALRVVDDDRYLVDRARHLSGRVQNTHAYLWVVCMMRPKSEVTEERISEPCPAE